MTELYVPRPTPEDVVPFLARQTPRLAILLVLVTVVVYVHAPDGAGYYVYLATTAALILAIAVAPLLRQERPPQQWMLIALAVGVVLLLLVGCFTSGPSAPWRLYDVPTVAVYLFLIAWIGTLGGTSGIRGAREGLALDMVALALGTALATWSLILAPALNEVRLRDGIGWALYPLFDAVLVAITLHVAVRLGRPNRPLVWLSLGVLFLLALDLIVFRVALAQGWDMVRFTGVGYLVALLLLTLCAAHPEAHKLAEPAHPGRRVQRMARTSVLVLLAFAPAIVALAVPPRGVGDSMVRGVLMFGIIVCIALRQRITMNALSRIERDSNHRAAHDNLTGLLNRAALVAELDLRLMRNRLDEAYTAVLFLDCDDFKHVNDTWGHEAGDAVLKAIAHRVPTVLSPDDIFGRQGGDEFVIVSTVSGLLEAKDLATRVREVCRMPVKIHEDRMHVVTLSIGISLADPLSGECTDQIINHADVAMYAAKRAGRGHTSVFDEDLAIESQLRAAAGERLGMAITEGAISTELQPIMGGPGYSQVAGFEALARWNDPELGPVSPEVFVLLAEQLGLVRDLNCLILESACLQISELRAVHPDLDLFVSVNVSPMQLRRSGLLDDVRKAIHRAGIPPRALRLEVIETSFVDNDPAVDTMVRALHNAGVGLWVDDFGTGYDSLTTLLRLPVECVKIDRSLARRVGRDPDAEARLEAVLHLVRSLRIHHVVVEGVETEVQVNGMARLGVPCVQGWFYGRAAPSWYWLETTRLARMLRE